MIVADEFIFLHLQKTGGNHVVRILEQFFALRQVGKHNGIVGDVARPHVLMGVRNPWDWYVSLWAYGCQQRGQLAAHLKADRVSSAISAAREFGSKPGMWGDVLSHVRAAAAKDPAHWRDLYADRDDVTRFREWLRAIHLAPTNRQTGEQAAALPMRDTLGLMTARYLRVASRDADWRRHRGAIRNTADAGRFLREHSVVTDYIRTEHLAEDAYRFLQLLRPEAPRDAVTKLKKTNSSTHHGADYYYDEDAIALVAARDAVPIAVHGYTFPR